MFGDPNTASALLLVGAVIVVGVLHTAAPDHWIPISVLTRQNGWSKRETAIAAVRAATGHVLSTLLIGVVVWSIGIVTARHFGAIIDTLSSLALITFGGWCVWAGLNELRADHGHHCRGRSHDHENERGEAADKQEIRHFHAHRHEGKPTHVHFHSHAFAAAHPLSAATELNPPLHDHSHKAIGRWALLVILGSSPMIEGIPAFFAAGKFGLGLILLMSILFAMSTITTYVVLCVYSASILERMKLGLLERYGEVLSGGFIMLVGAIFWISPRL